MGLQTIIKGYTAWANVRLVRSDCETNDIIRGIMQDIRMKVLLQGKLWAVCMHAQWELHGELVQLRSTCVNII